MSFNIQEFKSKMDQYGGPARTNLFTVQLAASNSSFTPNADLRFFCKTVALPSVSLETLDIKPNNIGMSQSMPTGITNDAVECIFMLDSNHQILSFFHEWMQNIVNYDMSNGSLAPNARDNQHMPYEINYKKGSSGYSMRMVISMYSSTNAQNYYECVLDDVYPKQVGSLNLSWEENDTPATLPVSFSYSSMKMSGTNSGSASNAAGPLQYFTTESNIGQMFTQIPQLTQNAIDNLAKIQPFSLASRLIRN